MAKPWRCAAAASSRLSVRACSAPPDIPEIKIGATAYIPDDYVPDTDQKMEFYQRLADAQDRHHELAGALAEAARDLQQHGHRRDHLEGLHLLDRARGDVAPPGEILEREAGLLAPLADPARDPGELGVDRLLVPGATHDPPSGTRIR